MRAGMENAKREWVRDHVEEFPGLDDRKMIRTAAMIILALFLGLYGYTQVELSRIERELPPVGAFVSTADGAVDLHYLREGWGIPVVMLHGRDASLQEFTLSIFDAVAEDYEAIAIDRPGYGYSACVDPERLTTEGQAQLLNEALTEFNIDRPIMLGHSYGAAVMLQYLLDYPDEIRAAISLGGVAYVGAPPDEGILALPRYPIVGSIMAQTVAVPFGRTVARGMYERAFSPAEPPEEYLDAVSSLYIRPDQLTATAYELASMYESVGKISGRYEEINVPLTIIFGESDEILSYEDDGHRLCEAVPGAELILVESAGHKLHHTHPQVVLDAIERLTHRIDRAGSQ